MNKIKTNTMAKINVMANTLFYKMENDLKLYLVKDENTKKLDIVVKSGKIYFRDIVNDSDDLLFILFDNFINKRKLKDELNLIVAIASSSETNQDDKAVLILFDNDNIVYKSVLDKYYTKR